MFLHVLHFAFTCTYVCVYVCICMYALGILDCIPKYTYLQFHKGTGKSIIGAHIAYEMAKRNKEESGDKCVLYCGPTNKSIDVIFGMT